MPTLDVVFQFVIYIYVYIYIYIYEVGYSGLFLCRTSPVVILCCCVEGTYVEELKCEISIHQMFRDFIKLFKDSKFEDENNHNFLKNFLSCIIDFCRWFFEWLKTMAQRGKKWIFLFPYFNLKQRFLKFIGEPVIEHKGYFPFLVFERMNVHCKGRDDVESPEERNVTGQSEDSKHKGEKCVV